jgi:DNA polymerase-4
MAARKTIWHLDLDCFFVSAERLRSAALVGKPVAVGGSGPRGVIASCSYEARKFGVRSAMPTAQALRRCKNLVLLPPDFELYSRLSKQVFSILPRYTPIFEEVSIDEAYLDMSGCESLFGPPLMAAERLRSDILKETGLTCSIGIAANRLVAKVATDLRKPNGLVEVKPGTEPETLAPLSVAKLPGCGKVTTKWLIERGIETIAQLQAYPLSSLERHFGKFGQYLHDSAWGRGSTSFHEESKSRSISREETFGADVSDPEKLRQIIWEMCSDLASSLRSENLFAHGTRLKLRYPPFQTVTRSRVLDQPEQRENILYRAALDLFEEHWDVQSPLRLVGVGFVVGDGDPQLDLFNDPQKSRDRQLADLKDRVQKRFGSDLLKTGREFK